MGRMLFALLILSAPIIVGAFAQEPRRPSCRPDVRKPNSLVASDWFCRAAVGTHRSWPLSADRFS